MAGVADVESIAVMSGAKQGKKELQCFICNRLFRFNSNKVWTKWKNYQADCRNHGIQHIRDADRPECLTTKDGLKFTSMR
jgi:hypothetical protein